MEGCKCKPAKSFAQRIIEYQEFASLVKRMREVQQEIACLPSYASDDELEREKYALQKEVDKLLEQMEV